MFGWFKKKEEPKVCEHDFIVIRKFDTSVVASHVMCTKCGIEGMLKHGYEKDKVVINADGTREIHFTRKINFKNS